jgi:hypothetical protein
MHAYLPVVHRATQEQGERASVPALGSLIAYWTVTLVLRAESR